MKTSLIKGLNEDDAKEIKGLFIEALRLRERLKSIINEKIESSRTGTLSADAYDSPSWAYKQADSVGYERGLREMISLLEEKEK